MSYLVHSWCFLRPVMRGVDGVRALGHRLGLVCMGPAMHDPASRRPRLHTSLSQ